MVLKHSPLRSCMSAKLSHVNHRLYISFIDHVCPSSTCLRRSGPIRTPGPAPVRRTGQLESATSGWTRLKVVPVKLRATPPQRIHSHAHIINKRLRFPRFSCKPGGKLSIHTANYNAPNSVQFAMPMLPICRGAIVLAHGGSQTDNCPSLPCIGR